VGLKQDIVSLKAQIRVWERERIAQDTVIQELREDVKIITHQLKQTTIIINQVSRDYSALRAATQKVSAGSDNDRSAKPGLLSGESDSGNQEQQTDRSDQAPTMSHP